MKKKVLLVEDNEPTLDVVQVELHFLGYEVLVARNGEEAVELATTQSPDLIVMDLLMPKMDGFKAAARLKSDSKTRAIPILAATAKAMPGDKEACLASGCDGYLAKPFSHEQLGAAIKQILRC